MNSVEDSGPPPLSAIEMLQIIATITTVASVAAAFVDWYLAAGPAITAEARGGDIVAEGAAGLARIRHPL